MSEILNEDIEKIANFYRDHLLSLANQKILITGATGMVGSYLALTLLAAAKNFFTQEDAPKLYFSCRSEEKAKQIFGDFIDSSYANFYYCPITSLDSEIEEGDVDYVMHCASPASPNIFKDDPVGVIDANVVYGKSLLDFSRKRNSQFCFVSSLEIYGDLKKEESPYWAVEGDFGAVSSLDQRSAYPLSKKLVENYAVAYKAQFDVPYSIARLSHTYGPGMSIDDNRVQTSFIKSALTTGKISLASDGLATRTYTYIADAAAGILLGFISKLEVFNIADKDSLISIRDLAKEVLVAAGKSEANLIFENEEHSDKLWSKITGLVVLDSTKLYQAGWVPKYSVSSGMKRSIMHFRSIAKTKYKV